ncbi:MAG: DUF6364 family protein [Balneolaceae bacterium]
MKEKLTLSIEKQTKERAKKIAFKEGVSISEMVENFLNSLPETDLDTKIPQDSLVTELAGSIKIPDDVDYDEELTRILEEKYND